MEKGKNRPFIPGIIQPNEKAELDETKKFLNSYRRARKLYNIAKGEAEEIETMLTSAAIDYSKVRVQTSPSDWTETMARLADLHVECVKQMEEATRAIEAVKDAIDQVEDEQQRAILSRRYIRLQRWEEIAWQLSIDYRNMFRIADKGVQAIKEKRDGI